MRGNWYPRGMLAVLVAEASFPERSSAWRFPGAGWVVHTPPRAELVVVDETLAKRARFQLPSAWRAVHCVTPDLGYAAVSERDRVLLIDATGRSVWEVKHHPWGDSDSECGSCWVSTDGNQVWATMPNADGPDEWRVIDVRSGRVLDRAALACHAAGSHPLGHPDGLHVGLSVGEGQDGCEVYWGRWNSGRLLVSRLDDRSRVLADVHPNGRSYFTTPHDGTAVALHAFPGGGVLARQKAEGVLDVDDSYDFEGGYLTADLVIAGSVEKQSHWLFDSSTLRPIAELRYPRGAVKDCILPNGRGTWLTSDYLGGTHQVWRLGEPR